MHYSKIIKDLEEIKSTFDIPLEEIQKDCACIENERDKAFYTIGMVKAKIDFLIIKIRNGG